ncbi:MAG: hypothetical protein FWE67_03295 [Planctomycetaceae bacterium]|nr:hypothetical protein [Planctomycetaceae bacterium]
MFFSGTEKFSEEFNEKGGNLSSLKRTISVLLAVLLSASLLFFVGCNSFGARRTAQLPPQTITPLPVDVPVSEPLDPRYNAYKPVLPPQNSSQNSYKGGYAVPTDNIIDNILGKGSAPGISADIPVVTTVKPLPLPEKKPAEAAEKIVVDKVVDKDKEQIEQLNKRVAALEKSLSEKDKQLSAQTVQPAVAQPAAPAAQVSAQPAPPQKTPASVFEKIEQPLPSTAKPDAEKKQEPEKQNTEDKVKS